MTDRYTYLCQGLPVARPIQSEFETCHSERSVGCLNNYALGLPAERQGNVGSAVAIRSGHWWWLRFETRTLCLELFGESGDGLVPARGGNSHSETESSSLLKPMSVKKRYCSRGSLSNVTDMEIAN